MAAGQLFDDLSILAAQLGLVVPSMECSGIPFGITAGGLTLNSLSLFTDHPLLRVSLITSRLLPMGRPRPRDEKDEKKEEDVDVDEKEEEWWMWMWMRMGMRGHHACAGPPDT